MDFDFALLLVILTGVAGVVRLFDWLFLARLRARRAESIKAMTALSEAERDARSRAALQEPVPIEYARSSSSTSSPMACACRC